MGYKKGEILYYKYPIRKTENINKTGVIYGNHRSIVLHHRETPFNTVLVAPITKATSLKDKNKIPSNYLKLLFEDYPCALDEDSFINLDMTMVVDELDLIKLNKSSKIISAILNPSDLYQLDYKITLTYELNKYFENELNRELVREFNDVIEYIDIDIREQIENLISNVKDKEMVSDIFNIINSLIDTLKNTYIKKFK